MSKGNVDSAKPTAKRTAKRSFPIGGTPATQASKAEAAIDNGSVCLGCLKWTPAGDHPGRGDICIVGYSAPSAPSPAEIRGARMAVGTAHLLHRRALSYLGTSQQRTALMINVTDHRSAALARIIEHGFSADSVNDLIDHRWVTMADVVKLVAPRRTLSHRKKSGSPLTPDESERLYNLARIVEMAADIFANDEKADNWLRRPNPRFDGAAPLDMLKTKTGALVVEDTLNAMAHGFNA